MSKLTLEQIKDAVHKGNLDQKRFMSKDNQQIIEKCKECKKNTPCSNPAHSLCEKCCTCCNGKELKQALASQKQEHDKILEDHKRDCDIIREDKKEALLVQESELKAQWRKEIDSYLQELEEGDTLKVSCQSIKDFLIKLKK